MPTVQSNSSFKTQIETLCQPYSKPEVVVKALMKSSPMLDFLFKFTEGDDKLTGLETFQNRYKKFGANAYYPYTAATLPDLSIALGDDKNPSNGRNLIEGEVAAFDKAWTMGITLEDKQRLEGYDTWAKVANWIEDELTSRNTSLAIAIENAIWNGTGTATRSDNTTRNDAYGLTTAIGNGTYAGINYSTNSFYEWQSQGTNADMSNWDMTSATSIFGWTVATSTAGLGFGSLAGCNQISSGYSHTPFYDVIQRAIRYVQRFSPKGSRHAVFMAPWWYETCFLKSLDAKTTTQRPVRDQETTKGETQIYTTWEYPKYDYEIGGCPVYSIDTTIPTAVNGSAPSYIFPKNQIFIIDIDSMKLGVNKSNNFIVSPWEGIPTQYHAMQKSVTTTLAFWCKNRFSNGVIKMPAALTTLAGAEYGISI